jgi:hypothetical protein
MSSNHNPLPSIRTGWASWLARIAAAYILYETISGLAVTLAPFHAAVEWNLLLHTAIGLLLLVPVAWYLFAHWKDYKSQALSDVLVIGYVAFGALFICLASGLVVTWQGLFGMKTSALWRNIHLGSTIATLAASVAHGVMSYLRRKSERASGLVWIGAVASVLMVAGGAGLAALYSGTKYVNEFPKDYSTIYGKDKPFAPSLARTSTGGAFDSRSLSGSDSCGTSACHKQIWEEWQPSAHRYAAMDPVFQGIQNVMAKQNGPESTRYCGGCHDPISLFSGTKNIFVENLTSLTGFKEGISCLACHAIQKTDIQGNANYTMTQPREYLWQWSGEGTAGAVARDFLIRTYPSEHNRLSKRMFKKPEYCAACHKQFIDAQVNRVGWVQLQNQYDNWAASHWNKKGDARKTLECRECHMPLVKSSDPSAGDSTDYNRTANDGMHRSHRFLAANNFVPNLLKLPGAEQHTDLTNAWLAGKYDIPEVKEKWANGEIVKVKLDMPDSVSPGEKFKVKVMLASNKVGHDYPTGPLDMIQSWLEIRVTDESGREVFASGRRDAKGYLEPGTFLFKAEPVDQYGNLIDRHNLWEMVGVRFRRSLFPGYSDTVEYAMSCPSGAAQADVKSVGSTKPPDLNEYDVKAKAEPGTYRVVAILKYRKIDQFLLNYVMGEDKKLTAPVVEIARAEANVKVTKKVARG